VHPGLAAGARAQSAPVGAYAENEFRQQVTHPMKNLRDTVAAAFMLTRITHHGKLWYRTPISDAKGIIAALADGSTACYTDRKAQFRNLCGSV
jgi:hypothetical protein